MKPTIYTHDRTAPRMKKGQFCKQVVTKELWKRFTRSHPEYSKMSWDDFFQYWQDIAKTIRDETIHNPLGVKLGAYTGELKLQYMPHDFKAEVKDQSVIEEVGEKINHINILTKGKVAKLKWERRWAVKFNKMLQFFVFEPVREMEVMAKAYIDAHPNEVRVARNTLGGYSVWRQLKKS